MRDVVRYSEAFKLRGVEDVAAGKYASLDEAAERDSRGLDPEQAGKTMRICCPKWKR